MFICQHCGEQVGPCQPANRAVVQWRDKSYVNIIKKGKNRGQEKETYGREIVQEKEVCPKCYIGLTGRQPKTAVSPSPRRRKRFRRRQRDRSGFSRAVKAEQTSQKRPIVETIRSLPMVKD